jgi:hypothetical protein
MLNSASGDKLSLSWDSKSPGEAFAKGYANTTADVNDIVSTKLTMATSTCNQSSRQRSMSSVDGYGPLDLSFGINATSSRIASQSSIKKSA